MKLNTQLFTLMVGLFCGTLHQTQAQYFGQNKPRYEQFNFRIKRTPHFELYHYFKDTTVANRILRNSEHWYEIHRDIFRTFFSEPNPVIFYKNHPDFQETTVISGNIGEGTGGVTEGLKNRVVMPVMQTHRQTDHVLGHELVHAFQYYSLIHTDTTSLNSIQNLPLWMVEGLAEYMSIGRVDSHTAMWMRDAVLNEDIPSLKDLNNPKYFPYRWGQAFWAFVGGNWGDQVIYPLFLTAARTGYISAIESVLGIKEEAFSAAWKATLRGTYWPYRTVTEVDPLGVGVATSDNAGRTNISPSLSPDGKYIAYISERNVISFDIYIAEVATGKVVRRVSSSGLNSHIDSFSFLETAGTWSPDSRKFAIVVQSKSRNKLLLLDVAQPSRDREVELDGLEAFSQPAWSPDGQTIVVSGLVEGVSDLYAYDLPGRKVRRLTNDFFSDIMPRWSPDGTTLYFVTDRGQGRPEQAFFQIAQLNVETGAISVLPLFEGADNLDPAVDPTGRYLYFLSDRDGFRNLYRYDVQAGTIAQMTRFFTGISGITQYSPAISVAQRTGEIVYTLYQKGGYELYRATPDQFAYRTVARSDVDRKMAELPPHQQMKGRRIVQPNLRETQVEPVVYKYEIEEDKYKPKFQLDYIGSTGVGVGYGQIGTQLAGGVQTLFSDILGYNQVAGALSLNGEIQDLGGQLFYLNQRRPFQWGVMISHIPYRFLGQGFALDTLNITQDGQRVNLLTQRVSTYIFRQLLSSAQGFAYLPFSRYQRLEGGGGFHWVNFAHTRFNEYYDLANQYIGQEREKLPGRPGFQYQEVYAAYVGDNASFGLTSPLDGYRFRFEGRQYFGALNVRTYTADMRRYLYLRPVSLAVRGLVNYRQGADESTNALFPLYIGYPGYVHGFFGGALNRQMENGLDVNRLIGTRMAIGNFEVRMPFTGPARLAQIKSGLFFSDLVGFVDAGVAWTGRSVSYQQRPFSDDQTTLTTDPAASPVKGDFYPVISTGLGLRVNLLGYLVLEPYFAFPMYNGKFGRGVFGLNFVPGW